MKIIKPSVEVIFHKPEKFESIEQCIEAAGRTCYKSENKITKDSAPKFVRMLRDRGHHAMLEFGYAQARIIGDRGVSHELVRHRLASYAQESTCCCNYSKGKFGAEITLIDYPWKSLSSKEKYIKGMKRLEELYFELLENGEPPEFARAVLPISTKAEIVIGANLREWRHIFTLRCSKKAHPIIRGVMLEILKQFNQRIPSLYEDLAEKFLQES